MSDATNPLRRVVFLMTSAAVALGLATYAALHDMKEPPAMSRATPTPATPTPSTRAAAPSEPPPRERAPEPRVEPEPVEPEPVEPVRPPTPPSPKPPPPPAEDLNAVFPPPPPFDPRVFAATVEEIQRVTDQIRTDTSLASADRMKLFQQGVEAANRVWESTAPGSPERARLHEIAAALREETAKDPNLVNGVFTR